VIILENDLYRRASSQQVDMFLKTAAHLAVIDSLENKTTEQAELLLPAATFAESVGTLVNNEGRAQRYFPVYPATEPVRGSWQWLTSAMENSGWLHHDDLTIACAEAFPYLAGIVQAAPGADYTFKGSKLPRQPHRYSGRTAMHADINVSEPGQPQDVETPFAFSMEGAIGQVPPALLPVIWAPGWNSNQAVNKFQEQIGGHLREGDVGIRLLEASGTLPWFTDMPVAFKPEPGLWRILSLPHIFGSEELSAQSPSVAERLPAFCVLLNPQDGKVLGVDTGNLVEICSLAGISILKIPVQIELTLPSGLVVITSGRSEYPQMNTLDPVSLNKVTQEDRL
jgi:NADH-quinone oxidoreductase subunit G